MHGNPSHGGSKGRCRKVLPSPEIQLGCKVNQQTNNSVIVISAEQATHLKERNKLLDAELDKISAAYESKRGTGGANGADQIREVESSLVPNNSVIELPPPARRVASWWGLLSSGDGSRGIAAPAAKFALLTITAVCVGSARAAGLKVSWESETPVLRDLWKALESACGPDGWQRLVARGSGSPPSKALAGSARRESVGVQAAARGVE